MARLEALGYALGEGDGDNVRFHFANVVRGVERLVQAWADGDLLTIEDEAWSPMRRASMVPLRPDQEEALRADGDDDALLETDMAQVIAEVNQSEVWANEVYTVLVTRHPDGWVRELSIRRNDRKAVHDWRHFQRIKSEIAGPEIEAVELCPRESRLMDTANQYYVYCLPPGLEVPCGFTGARNLADADDQTAPGAVQRPLPPDWKSTRTTPP